MPTVLAAVSTPRRRLYAMSATSNPRDERLGGAVHTATTTIDSSVSSTTPLTLTSRPGSPCTEARVAGASSAKRCGGSASTTLIRSSAMPSCQRRLRGAASWPRATGACARSCLPRPAAARLRHRRPRGIAVLRSSKWPLRHAGSPSVSSPAGSKGCRFAVRPARGGASVSSAGTHGPVPSPSGC